MSNELSVIEINNMIKKNNMLIRKASSRYRIGIDAKEEILYELARLLTLPVDELIGSLEFLLRKLISSKDTLNEDEVVVIMQTRQIISFLRVTKLYNINTK